MYTFIDKLTGKIINDPIIIEYYTMIAESMNIPYGKILEVKAF